MSPVIVVLQGQRAQTLPQRNFWIFHIILLLLLHPQQLTPGTCGGEGGRGRRVFKVVLTNCNLILVSCCRCLAQGQGQDSVVGITSFIRLL